MKSMSFKITTIFILILLVYSVDAQIYRRVDSNFKKLERYITRVHELVNKFNFQRARTNILMAHEELEKAGIYLYNSTKPRLKLAQLHMLKAKQYTDLAAKLIMALPFKNLKVQLDDLIDRAERELVSSRKEERYYLLHQAKKFRRQAYSAFLSGKVLRGEQYYRIAFFFARKCLDYQKTSRLSIPEQRLELEISIQQMLNQARELNNGNENINRMLQEAVRHYQEAVQLADEGKEEMAVNRLKLIRRFIYRIYDQADDYFYANLDEEDEVEFIEEDGMLQKPILPLRFGRVGVRPIIKDIRIVMTSDTTATALFTKILRGRFVIMTMDSEYNWIRVNKKMGHEFKRIAHFVKRGNEGEDLRRRWRVKEFSMVLGQSMGVVDSNLVRNSVEISKIIVETDTAIVIEDPLEFMQTRTNVFTFTPGTEVTVTVYVENSSDNTIQVPAGKGTELVRLHFARHRKWRHTNYYKHGIRHLRWIGEENGQNVYQGTWTVRDWLRVHHAVIDVIDNGTIFNDDIDLYPYNSVTWSTPYLIRPLN